MQLRHKFYIGLVLIATNFCLFGAGDKELVVFAVPGQNGLGSGYHEIKDIYGENFHQVAVATPSKAPDFGQSNCIDLLEQVIQRSPRRSDNEVRILHGSSQGSATTLNYLANHADSDIQAVVLEAVLGSGNSAIMHTVTGPIMDQFYPCLKPLAKVLGYTGSYYWFPYAARMAFPFYDPSGCQPVKEIGQITRDMPIIIVHAKDDPQLSIDDARAIYYGLRKNGLNNVYLIEGDGQDHVNPIAMCSLTAPVQQILRAKSILEAAGEEDVDLQEYQPDIDGPDNSYQKAYEALRFKEKVHTILGWGMVGIAGAAAVITVGCFAQSALSSFADSWDLSGGIFDYGFGL